MAGEGKKSILIVDDDQHIRTQMKWALAKEYDVFPAEDRPAALSLCQEHLPGVMTLDLGLPPDPNGTSEGLQTLQEILRINPKIKVIIITGNQEKSNALKAIELGAYDFHNKPVDLDELKIVLRRAYNLYAIEEELSVLRDRQEHDQTFEGIIGESAPIRNVFSMIEKVATTDTSVLITGESGVGKELIAQAIHARSLRKNKPFIPINCAAIPENLLESELFGYERGAFTGAHTRKIGKFELAEKGTLFLDEMGELGHALQAKLLRFLQDQMIERVGGKNPIQLDVRIITATNQDLQEVIQAARFREDLFFRLNEIHIVVPPLRERAKDALLLANLFLHRFAQENKRAIKGFSAESQKLITDYSWPGNVRELQSRIKRAVVMAENSLLTPKDLDLIANPSITLKEAREQMERKLIRQVLEKHRGNVTQAAKELGITRPTLHHMMNRYGVSKQNIAF